MQIIDYVIMMVAKNSWSLGTTLIAATIKAVGKKWKNVVAVAKKKPGAMAVCAGLVLKKIFLTQKRYVMGGCVLCAKQE